MGCNFYTEDDIHIGKRHSAGLWCWDCNEYVGSEDECPVCGAKRTDDVEYNGAFVELGFQKCEPMEHSGIDGASGFIWQVGYYGLSDNKDEVIEKIKNLPKVKDEYGREYTPEEFLAMFDNVITEETEEGEFW